MREYKYELLRLEDAVKTWSIINENTVLFELSEDYVRKVRAGVDDPRINKVVIKQFGIPQSNGILYNYFEAFFDKYEVHWGQGGSSVMMNIHRRMRDKFIILAQQVTKDKHFGLKHVVLHDGTSEPIVYSPQVNTEEPMDLAEPY